ncbi:beta-lactamase/transpeptidase-like protein [Dactylonectria estremocensis]|uniref:Beta-lactamase/transpeptidase-like protein n=1 Tax=Dactylonectria estremocensis TaxID=1079267 RepID=A0A9P9FCJ9_9HYPO|nr:beta-lactamase/transpeptidase-like protein [Dactylonectria estremocensis]
MPSLSKLAVLAVGAFTLADAKACPPMGAVFPAPQAPSQNTAVKKAVSALKGALDEQTSALFEASALSVGVKSIHEDDPLFTYHFTPPKAGSGAQEVGDDTMYRIASVSKLFTVLAALQNTDIDMNASVLKYLPQLNETATDDPILSLNWEEITVASLAGHLSGLGVDLAQDLGVVGSEAWVQMGLPEFSAKTGPTCSGLPGTTPCTREDLIEQVNRRPPIYEPYTVPVYSNIGLAMLGLVVEAASNKTFNEIVTQDILDVVGMKHTSTGKPPGAEDIFIPEGDSIWNSTLEVFDSAGGMYSSLGDLQAFGEAILTNKLLSPVETRKWMKPASATSSWGYMVGHPWEILRTDNVTSDGRLIDIYAKSGDLGLYHTLTALVPDYDLVVTVIMAGAEASAPYGAAMAFSAVVQALLPAIEVAGREQAKATYVGKYTQQSTNSSITFKMDDGPGLLISEWTVRGYNVLRNIGGYSWATLETGQVSSKPPVAARVYPTNLQNEDEDQVAWRAVFDNTNATADAALDSKLFFKDGSCQTWFLQDRQTYNFLSLDEFVFTESEGEAQTVKSPAFNVTLSKVHPAPEKKTSAGSVAAGAPAGVLGAALMALSVLVSLF